jgi:vitamin B12 transporter
MSDNSLEAVVVTASRVEEIAGSVPVAVTVITEDDIERLKPYDLGDLLKHFGIQIGEYGLGNGFAAVTIRGFSTSGQASDAGDILFLLDGRRYGLNNVSTIPMENIARVEVIKGAASMQYGPEAIGGVVNLISKRGSEDFKLKISQQIGSFGISKSRLGVSGMIKNFDYSIGGMYARNNDFSLPDGSTLKNTHMHYKILGSANLGYNFTPDQRVGFVFSQFGSVNSRSGGVRPTASDPYNVRYATGEIQRENWSWDLNYQGALPDLNLSYLARYHKGHDNYVGTENRFNYHGGRYSSIQHSYEGASVSASWSGAILHLTGGMDYYREEMNKSSIPQYSAYKDIAGYLIAKVGLLEETIWLSAGVRYDSFEVESLADTGVKSNDLTRTTPSLGVSYSPFPFLRVRANYSTAYRLPTPNQLSADYINAGWRNIGNPNIKPQSAKTMEGGVDFSFFYAMLSLTYFTTDYKDMIQQVVSCPSPTCDPGERTYTNLDGTTKFRGLEASLDWEMGHYFDWPFDLKPSVSLTRMYKYDNVSSGVKTVIVDVADINISYGISLSYPEIGLKASVDAYYYGQQWDSDGYEVGGDTIVDIHIEKELYDFGDKGKLSVGADVVNATNRLYMTVDPYLQPGRHFMVNLTYEY